MRKSLSILLIVLLIVSTALFGCSNKSNTEKASNIENKDLSSSDVTSAGSFPLTKEKITFKIMVPSATNVTDLTTNDFTKYYESLTNVHIEWEVVPSANLTEKVNLSLSSGDMPDMYMNCGLSLSQVMVYGSQGAFVDLTPYIDKYSPLLKKALEVVPGLKDVLTMPDGKIYSMPYLEWNPHVLYSQKLWINKEWLDKLKLQVPTTTEEFYNVLKAFKEEDPNGNGKADEIPLSASIDGWNSTIDTFLINPFIYNDTLTNDPNTKRMYVDNGKVEVNYNKPEFREALKYLNRLYKENLLDHQALTQTTEQLQQKGEDPSAELLGAFPGGVPTGVKVPSSSNRWTHYIAIAPLKGPNGNRVAVYNPWGTTDFARVIITKACKYPDVAFRWNAEMYDKDIAQRKLFGEEGKSWKKAEPGMKALYQGEQADVQTFIDGVQWGDPQNYCWRHYGVRLETDAMPENMYKQYIAGDINTNIEYRLYKDTVENYVPYAPELDKIIPPLSQYFDLFFTLVLMIASIFTDSENERVSPIAYIRIHCLLTY